MCYRETLPFDCLIRYRLQIISYYKRFSSPWASLCAHGGSHLCGWSHGILRNCQAPEAKCDPTGSQWARGHLVLPPRPHAQATTPILPLLRSPAISSTIWEDYNSPESIFLFLKKNPKRLWPLLLDHNACCFCVQVDLNRLFLPFHWQWSCNRAWGADASMLQSWEGVRWSVGWMVGCCDFYPRYQDWKTKIGKKR